MTDKLQTVKEALEFYAHSNWDGYIRCKPDENILRRAQAARAKDFNLMSDGTVHCDIDNYDTGEFANKALTTLNSYIEARDSKEMVERVALSMAKVFEDKTRDALVPITATEVVFRLHKLGIAKAAIKALEGGE